MLRVLQSVFSTRLRVLVVALCLVAAVTAILAWWPAGPAPPAAARPASTPAVPPPGPGLEAPVPTPAGLVEAGPVEAALPPPRASVSPPAARGSARLSVRSILVGADRRLALVDGRIVGPGDRVGGAVVVAIGPRAVELRESGGGRRRLELARPAPGAEVR